MEALEKADGGRRWKADDERAICHPLASTFVIGAPENGVRLGIAWLTGWNERGFATSLAPKAAQLRMSTSKVLSKR